MSKEELIKFIESIDFELMTNLSITYYKEKPSSYYGNNDDDKYRPKTINFNRDYEYMLNDRIRSINEDLSNIRERIYNIESEVHKNE